MPSNHFSPDVFVTLQVFLLSAIVIDILHRSTATCIMLIVRLLFYFVLVEWRRVKCYEMHFWFSVYRILFTERVL